MPSAGPTYPDGWTQGAAGEGRPEGRQGAGNGCGNSLSKSGNGSFQAVSRETKITPKTTNPQNLHGDQYWLAEMPLTEY